MSTDGPQYGEDAIILDYFSREPGGFVVDCGAADGVSYSNSRFLIRDYHWSAILIEPEPEQFHALQYLYANTPNVQTIEAAVSDIEGHAMLHPSELGSTLLDSWRERTMRSVPHMQYGPPIKVRAVPLRTLLHEANCPPTIDFLTIDCEGMDLAVLQSMDWKAHEVDLVCVESGSDGSHDDPLNNYLKSIGYEYHAHTLGNTFWRRA